MTAMCRKGGFSVKKIPFQGTSPDLLTVNVEFSGDAESLAGQILRHTGVVTRVL
jgi:hypothetical protein